MKKLIFILTLTILLFAFFSCADGEEIDTGTETFVNTEEVTESEAVTEIETDEVTPNITETAAETETEAEAVTEEKTEEPPLPSLDSLLFWQNRENIIAANLPSVSYFKDHDEYLDAFLTACFPEDGISTKRGGSDITYEFDSPENGVEGVKADLYLYTNLYENGTVRFVMLMSINGYVSYITVCDGETVYDENTALLLVNSDPRFDGNYILSEKEEEVIEIPEGFDFVDLRNAPAVEKFFSDYGFPFARAKSSYPIEVYCYEKDKIRFIIMCNDLISTKVQVDEYDGSLQQSRSLIYGLFEYDLITSETKEIDRLTQEEYLDLFYPDLGDDVWYESDTLVVFDDENGDLAVKYKDTGEVMVIYDNFTYKDFDKYINDNPDADSEESLVLLRGADMVEVWQDQYVHYYVFGFEWSIGGGFFDTKTRSHSSFTPGALFDITNDRIFIYISKNEELGLKGGIYYIDYTDNMEDFEPVYLESLNSIDSFNQSLVSPNGKYFAYAKNSNETSLTEIYLINIEADTQTKYITDEKYVSTIAFTVNGDLVAFNDYSPYFFILDLNNK